MKSIYLYFIPLILLCTLFIGCDVDSIIKNDTYAISFEKDISAEGVQKIIVDNVDGNIDIRIHKRNEIAINAEKHVTANTMDDARDFSRRVDVDVYREGDVLHIDTEFPHSKSRSIGEVGVDYEIRVPQKMHVEIFDTNGDVTVQDINGDVDITTTNGDINVDNISGDVETTNANGSIDLLNIDGNVDAQSTNGDLYIMIINAQVNCTARTTNGDITLYIPNNASTRGTARTTRGDIESDFPSERPRREDRLEFVLGSGNGELDLWTTNGDIELLALDKIESRRRSENR